MKIVCVDTHYLVHRAFWAAYYSQREESVSPAAYMVLRDVQRYQDDFPGYEFVFAFDSGRSVRKTILPTYKQNRKKDKEVKQASKMLRGQIQLLRKVLKQVGFVNLFSQPSYEADDIIASVVLYREWEQVVIVSGDRDLYQLLEHNVTVYDPRKRKHMSYAAFQREYGIPPHLWPNVKAMAGDKSDNIEGIPRIGEKSAIKWFRSELPKDSGYYKRILDNLHIHNANLRLVSLPMEGTNQFTVRKSKVTSRSWREGMEQFNGRST